MIRDEKFEYFMKRTEDDLKKINEKLDALWSFRLLILGATMTISTVFAVLTSLITLAIK